MKNISGDFNFILDQYCWIMEEEMIEWSSKVRDYHGAKKKTPWSKCDCVSKKKLRPNPTGLHSITGVWLQMVVQATFIMFTKSDELIHPWPQNTRFLLNIYPMPQKLRVGSAALSIVCVWSDCVCASLAGLCDPLTTILLFFLPKHLPAESRCSSIFKR